MKMCIHRGTKEIGGTCIEIQSQGKRLVLDVGLPLDCMDPDDLPLHPVSGFQEPDDSLLGVVISHPHQDHYGLAYRLPQETKFLIGKAAEAILSAACLFSPSGVKLTNTIPLEDRSPIELGPFRITPFLVDHSAYDSYAVLIEADGKRLFYSGDFRSHGRKAGLVERLIAHPPSDVDVLLMEGTCVGREDETFSTEDQLVEPMAEIFKQTKGMPLVWCSGQNIDRIVTIFKACRKANRQFIIDMYTAEILRATGNQHLPQAKWDGIRVFLPSSQKFRIKENKEFELAGSYKPSRIYDKELADAASGSVMLFRPSMVRDLDRAQCLAGTVVVCSVWSGYLKEPRQQSFVEWMNSRKLRVEHCHTSGHASVSDLKRLREAFGSAVAVPVHLTDRERFSQVFSNVRLREDGEWWGI